MMSNKTFCYIRVCSKEQNTDRQKQALLEYGVDERDIIGNKVIGKDFNRKRISDIEKNSLLRDGDTLVKRTRSFRKKYVYDKK